MPVLQRTLQPVTLHYLAPGCTHIRSGRILPASQ
jgi:hypothetical protein